MSDRARELAEAIVSDPWIDARLQQIVARLLCKWDTEDKTGTSEMKDGTPTSRP